MVQSLGNGFAVSKWGDCGLLRAPSRAHWQAEQYVTGVHAAGNMIPISFAAPAAKLCEASSFPLQACRAEDGSASERIVLSDHVK